MAAGGDVIELVHEQAYLGQQVNNVYYFEAVSGSATLPGLATWFETNVVPRIKTFQNDLLAHINLRLRNLYNLTETYEEPLTGNGGIVSGALEMPSFFACTARLDHANGSVRPGFKRWAGLIENSFGDALMDPTTVAQIGLVCDQLVNPPATANPNWAHVIIGRVCETPNPVPGAIPVCLKYRLPEIQAESNPAYPVSYEVYAQPTTQSSRKWYT